MQLKVVHRAVRSPRSRVRWGRRVAAALVAAALATGCVRKPAQSEVASGNRFEAGEPSYDEFFKSLYDVQLTMGHAPDREQAVRLGLAKVADTPPTASNDELSAALDKRLDALSRHGVAVKLSATDLEGTDPSGKLQTSGTSSDAADAKSVSDLQETVKGAAALLTDLRHAKPELEKLKEALPPLEEKVDNAFGDATRTKKDAVRQNLKDADQLIPLMVARGDEVDGHVMDMLRAVQKASPAAIATTPPPPLDTTPKKKEKKPKGESKSAAPKPPKEPKEPKAEAPAPKPPEEPKPKPAEAPKPKPKPKPADDFEP